MTAIPDPPMPAAPPPPEAAVSPLSNRDEPDGVEYLDETLRVRLRIGSSEYTLSPPLLGQFKEFRLRLAKLDEDQRKAAAANDPASSQVVATGVVETMRWLVKTLSGRDLPAADDDLPTWMGSPLLTQQLIAHWQQVPLLSGTSGG